LNREENHTKFVILRNEEPNKKLDKDWNLKFNSFMGMPRQKRRVGLSVPIFLSAVADKKDFHCYPSCGLVELQFQESKGGKEFVLIREICG